MTPAKRLREIMKAILTARFPAAPKRRHDITGDAISQAFGGKGGGRRRIREGGEEDERA
jgi:hypothetical protein